MKHRPAPLTVNTGEQHKVSKTIDDFFTETKNFVQKNHEAHDIYFQIKSGEIGYIFSQLSNDKITYLSYRDQVIASVLETRTEFNHIRYTFFRNLNDLKNLSL